MEDELNGFPRWVAKMYPGKTGRDHLGLGSVSSDQILPTLVPSINVLTFHPRYHSFYIFLLDEYWRKELPRNRAAWKKFFRPREFIFSVGAYLCQQPEHGNMGNIVGGRKTKPLATQELPSYDTKTDYMDSPLGGFGLYYRTVMAELGLLHPGGRGLPYPVDLPTEHLGQEIAAAFRKEIENTEYYQEYFHLDQAEIPRDTILEYIHEACLCQLKTDNASDRKFVREVFEAGGPNEASGYRKLTLRMFLDIANQTRQTALDQDLFRQLIYFGETQTDIQYLPISELDLIHKQWRMYQAREYYAFALNTLWGHFCYWGLKNYGDKVPVDHSKISDYLKNSLSFDIVATKLGFMASGLSPKARISELLNWIEKVVGGSRETFDKSCDIHSLINEHLLYQLIGANEYNERLVLPAMFLMLALVYLRFGHMDLWQMPEWDISKMGTDGRLSLNGFVRQTKKMVDDGASIYEFAKLIFDKSIIQQHIIVSTRKLPDNTFRFRREGRRLRFFQHDNSLGFMNSRFDSISTTVFELGYCGDLHLPDHGLTEDGEQFLKGRI